MRMVQTLQDADLSVQVLLELLVEFTEVDRLNGDICMGGLTMNKPGELAINKEEEQEEGMIDSC